MPNTYYLKMTGAPLMSRLQRGLQTTALEGAWALWPIAVLAAAARPLSGHRRLPTLVAVASGVLGVRRRRRMGVDRTHQPLSGLRGAARADSRRDRHTGNWQLATGYWLLRRTS
jgi:hypothetical protein